MEWSFLFFGTAVLLGVGLAMDAFSVSLANGLNEPHMPAKRMMLIAGTFGVFQFVMPVIGWICVHGITELFSVFQKFIPWIALLLLLYIGGKMLWDGLRGDEENGGNSLCTSFARLLLMGLATSIDALSVGFTMAEYSFGAALAESLIIGAITTIICVAGLLLGRKFGTMLAGKASALGGIILILIGIEIFVKGVFFA